jgi:hypothetical protein
VQRAFRFDGKASGQSKSDYRKAMKWAEIIKDAREERAAEAPNTGARD